MRWFVLFLGGAACALLSLNAHAYLITPLDEIENQGVPVVQPTTVIPFNQSNVPGDIALSADGQHLVYSESSEVLDIWAAIVYYWPELVAGIAAIVILTRVVAGIRRRRKYPDERGPYCASCAYPTQGLQASDCPECGKPLDGKGTTSGMTQQRLLITQLLLLGIAGLIGVGYAMDPPRDVQARRWITWRSELLADWASNQQQLELYESIRPCTIARTIPINKPSEVKTICRVMDTKDFDFLSFLALHSYHGPRPLRFENLASNTPQTYTGIKTSDYFTVIDLQTLRVIDAGPLIGDDYYHMLSDDGQSRVGYNWSDDYQFSSVQLDGTGNHALDYVEHSVVKLNIRTRGSNVFSSLGFDDDEADGHQPAPYTDQQIEIICRQAQAVQLYLAKERLNSIGVQVAADYVLLMGSRSVLIYDLVSDRWIAQLDLSPILASRWVPDGTSIAISADRSTAAVINNDGSQVAVYQLPVSN